MEHPIIGHKKIFNFFDKVIENQALSHAYCFSGPEHVGKKTTAEELSARLFETTREKLGVIPDYALIQQGRDEKTGKKKKDISISQLKNANSFLSQRPFLKKYKIVIVDKAEKMSLGAANALLKTLEEPPEYSMLFLITKDDTALPQTVRSRCQTVYFHPAQENDIFLFLKKNAFDEEKAHEMTRISLGLPGKVIEWIEAPEAYEIHKKEILRFCRLYKKPFYEKMKTVEDLFGDKTDHISARENLSSILNIWEVFVRDSAIKELAPQSRLFHHVENMPVFSKKNIYNIYKQIRLAKKLINKNIHPKLLLENILLQIP